MIGISREVDSAPEEIECLRKALVKTEDTMKEAQLATASHDAANRPAAER